MTPPLSTSRRVGVAWRGAWKGPWLLAVAAVHTAFAVAMFQPQWHEIARRGVFDSVGTDPMLGAVVWFGLFGAALALLGWSILILERHGALAPAALRPLGLGVLALTLAGIVLRTCSRSFHGVRMASKSPRSRRTPPPIRMYGQGGQRRAWWFWSHALRVAPQKLRPRRCKSSPGHQPDCGLRLAATAFAGQRTP